MQHRFPFSAIVGQDLMKRALLLNVVDPGLGGVLIRGERGTAKSTGVRALVRLLPTIRVVENCPFQCDPDHPEETCPHCREKGKEGHPLPAGARPIRLVNLPIGATEDRLLGTIDVEKALKTGRKAFEPGLLAEAHRGILYVDEVNLLNDQIVDLFLDASASGVNVVEREGVSLSHPSRFILVGTMNPEEGDLRPQLLDRFGLCASIEGIQDVEQRMEIVKRRLAFEQDPEGFREEWREADEEWSRKLAAARSLLPEMAFPRHLLETASRLAVAMKTDGHRADIVMMKAARANAALEGREKVSREDLQLASRLVLPHRMKKTPLQKAELDEKRLRQVFEESAETEAAGEEWRAVHRNKQEKAVPVKNQGPPLSCVTHLCSGARPFQPRLPWHLLQCGSHAGRRFLLADARKEGPVHGSRLFGAAERLEDLSVMATVRAAAPFQIRRGANGALKLRSEDLRRRKRSRKTGLALVMIIDSSASMRTNDRMSATKGIIDALLQDLYLRRDKMGIVTFRHTGADVVLPLTRNIRNAAREVESLPAGGRTPLASGLDLGVRLLVQEKRKNPQCLPLLVVFSDGNPNVSCFGGDPLEETLDCAREVRRRGIQAILVDTESNPMAMGCAYEISRQMGALYLPMDRLKDGIR